MKFEKINKDKIKVTLNSDDLTSNAIDFHSFMSNSDETHSLFLDVLDKAEKDYNFETKNYKLKVETIALTNGTFILTITRISETDDDKPKENMLQRRKVKVNRKVPKVCDSSVVYRFDSFEDFCSLSNNLVSCTLINYSEIANDTSLYEYKGYYFFILRDINIHLSGLKGLFSLITEFGYYVDFSDVFIAKLYENGTPIFLHNAMQDCIKYFA